MNSYEIIEKINHLLNNESDLPIETILSEIADYQSDFESLINNLIHEITRPEKISSIAIEIDSISEQVTEKLFRVLSPRIVFKVLVNFERNFSSFSSSFSNFSENTELFDSINRFSEKYENYLEYKNNSSLYSFLTETRVLLGNVKVFKNSLLTIKEGLEKGNKLQSVSDETLLSIYMDSTPNFENITIKLIAFLKIYEELCRLLQVSTTEHPLKIAHLEYGSLWINMFGESKVIELITKIITETTGYFYRNRTKEGRRKETTNKLDEVKGLLDIEKELSSRGIDTSELKHSIEKSTHIISKEYLKILSDSSFIQVNDVQYDFNQNNPRGLFINTKSLYLLEDGEEKDS